MQHVPTEYFVPLLAIFMLSILMQMHAQYMMFTLVNHHLTGHHRRIAFVKYVAPVHASYSYPT